MSHTSLLLLLLLLLLFVQRRYECVMAQLQGVLALAREAMKRSPQELFLCARDVPLRAQDPQYRFLFDMVAFHLVEVQQQVSATGVFFPRNPGNPGNPETRKPGNPLPFTLDTLYPLPFTLYSLP